MAAVPHSRAGVRLVPCCVGACRGLLNPASGELVPLGSESRLVFDDAGWGRLIQTTVAGHESKVLVKAIFGKSVHEHQTRGTYIHDRALRQTTWAHEA
eukprot:2414179-Alexandrium_andersonii.AAC.1